MKIPRILYEKLLRSQEYAPYLFFKSDKVFIDMVNIPKESYLPINKNYEDGLNLCWQINDSEKDDILLVEPIDL